MDPKVVLITGCSTGIGRAAAIALVQAGCEVGLCAARCGRGVNIGSIGGRLSAPANGAYTATKYVVEALNDAMRWELGSFGIGVVLIEPGNIKTSFMETAIRSSSPLLKSKASPYAALYAGFAKATDALRTYEPGPETVAQVILQAIRAKKPCARYQAAVPHATRIAASLPDRGKDYVMRRFYGLGPPGLALPKK